MQWRNDLISVLMQCASERLRKETAMNNSRFTKSVSIVMVIAGFLLFTATWLSHAF